MVVAVVEVICLLIGGDWMTCRSASTRGDLQELARVQPRLPSNCCDLSRTGHWSKKQWRQYRESLLCLRPVSFFLSNLTASASADGTSVPTPANTRVVLTARELTIEAAQSASSSRAYKPVPSVRNGSFSQIKKLLDSRSDRDILDGLRKVIAVRNTFP